MSLVSTPEREELLKMIPVSTAEKNLGEKTFFVSTFLDKYKESQKLA